MTGNVAMRAPALAAVSAALTIPEVVPDSDDTRSRSAEDIPLVEVHQPCSQGQRSTFRPATDTRQGQLAWRQRWVGQRLSGTQRLLGLDRRSASGTLGIQLPSRSPSSESKEGKPFYRVTGLSVTDWTASWPGWPKSKLCRILPRDAARPRSRPGFNRQRTYL